MAISPTRFFTKEFWHSVSEVKNKQTSLFTQCSSSDRTRLVHPDNLVGSYETSTVVSKKVGDTWQLLLEEDTQNTRLLVPEINYSGEFLTRSLGSIERYIIYPSCTRECILNRYDILTGEIREMSVVTTASDTHDDSVEDLKIHFYDEKTQLLVFESPRQKKAFVVSFSTSQDDEAQPLRPYLWHDIALETHQQTQLEVWGVQYDPLEQLHLLVKVVSTAPNGTDKEKLVLYNLTTPAVRLVSIPDGLSLLSNQWVVQKPEHGCVITTTTEGEQILVNYE